MSSDGSPKASPWCAAICNAANRPASNRHSTRTCSEPASLCYNEPTTSTNTTRPASSEVGLDSGHHLLDVGEGSEVGLDSGHHLLDVGEGSEVGLDSGHHLLDVGEGSEVGLDSGHQRLDVGEGSEVGLDSGHQRLDVGEGSEVGLELLDQRLDVGELRLLDHPCKPKRFRYFHPPILDAIQVRLRPIRCLLVR